MFLDLTYPAALRFIGESERIWSECVVPRDCPPVSHSPYRPGYDWLFTYERLLAKVLSPWLKDFRHSLIGDRGILSEAMSNAYCHGNGRDDTQPIELSVEKGERGIVVRIKNGGTGFNVHQVISDFRNGRGYFHLAGNGIRTMVESEDFGVFFDDNGTAFHLLYAFNSALRELAKNPEALQSPRREVPWDAAALEDPGLGLQWALLMDDHGGVTAGAGDQPHQYEALAEMARHLFRASARMASLIGAGPAARVDVFIGDAQTVLLVCADPDSSGLLVARLDENANPVMASLNLQRLRPQLDALVWGGFD